MIPGRRKLLIFMATLPAIFVHNNRQQLTKPIEFSQFQKILRNTSSARAIGNAYLAKHEHNANADLITTKLFDNKKQLDNFFNSREEKQRYIIGRMVQDDFEAGALVSVNGWLLSQTEARVYAIISLTT